MPAGTVRFWGIAPWVRTLRYGDGIGSGFDRGESKRKSKHDGARFVEINESRCHRFLGSTGEAVATRKDDIITKSKGQKMRKLGLQHGQLDQLSSCLSTLVINISHIRPFGHDANDAERRQLTSTRFWSGYNRGGGEGRGAVRPSFSCSSVRKVASLHGVPLLKQFGERSRESTQVGLQSSLGEAKKKGEGRPRTLTSPHLTPDLGPFSIGWRFDVAGPLTKATEQGEPMSHARQVACMHARLFGNDQPKARGGPAVDGRSGRGGRDMMHHGSQSQGGSR